MEHAVRHHRQQAGCAQQAAVLLHLASRSRVVCRSTSTAPTTLCTPLFASLVVRLSRCLPAIDATKRLHSSPCDT